MSDGLFKSIPSTKQELYSKDYYIRSM